MSSTTALTALHFRLALARRMRLCDVARSREPSVCFARALCRFWGRSISIGIRICSGIGIGISISSSISARVGIGTQ